MRPNSGNDSRASKANARKQYIDRQVDKWVQWSWKRRGYVKHKELIEQIKRITEHAERRSK